MADKKSGRATNRVRGKVDKKKYLWIVLNAAFILFMVKLDAFVVNVSLPTIASSFRLDLAQASNVIVAYLLLLTNTMLIFGKIEDKIGVKKLMLSGYFLFTLGSFLCGVSPNIDLLILSRALQGIGGAMLLICGFGAVGKFLPKEIEGWGMGIVTTAAALGIATGAPLGGYITYFFDWRLIFFVNVPLGILGITATSLTIPDEKISAQESTQKFDYVGAILSFIGLSGITYALAKGARIDILVLSLLIIAVFIFWESKCKYPLVELKIFNNLGFVYANIAVFIVFMILSGSDFIIPFFLELLKGLNPYQVGLFMLLYSAAYSIIAPFAGRVLDNPKHRIINIISCVVVSAAFIAYSLTLSQTGIIALLLFLTVWGVSNAFIVPENFRLVFANTPADKKGICSGIFNVINNLSMVFGVCMYQLIFSNIVGSHSFSGQMSVDALSLAFKWVFIFGGALYLFVVLFSQAAENASRPRT